MSDNAQHLHTALCAYTDLLVKSNNVFPVCVPYDAHAPINLGCALLSFLYIYSAYILSKYPQAISKHIHIDVMSHRYAVPNYYLCYLNP